VLYTFQGNLKSVLSLVFLFCYATYGFACQVTSLALSSLSFQSLLCGDADNAQAVAAASSTSLTNSIKVAVAKAQASATAANGNLSSQALIAFPACLSDIDC